jgi:hypothetical protein
MEIFLTTALLGIGYYFNRDGLQRDKKYSVVDEVPKIIKPNGKNVYESRRSVDIREQEQQRANRLFERAKDPVRTNVGVAGPPFPRWNKADGDQRNLPLEFDEEAKVTPGGGSEYIPYKNSNTMSQIENKQAQMNVFDAYPTTGGWNGISLSGEPINKRTFVHNNMVPFFGGSVRQNVDERSVSATAILENFTGNIENYQKKKEISPMFDPQNNIGNPYGTQNLSDYNRERYVVSNLRNNESPTEKVYIGPGLNQGYTAEPSGGFQQEDTLLYVRPKTVDELRVKTNPKMSYYNRIIAGKKIDKPGKVGMIEKNRPDRFYVNSSDRYFTTTGACVGPTQRPKEILKYVNRATTVLKSRFGTAGTTTGSIATNRPKVQQPRRKKLTNSGFRNLFSNLFSNPDQDDYGKKGVLLRNVDRKISNLPSGRNGNMQARNIQAPTRNGQNPRQTRKTNVIGNGRWTGNVGAVQNQAGVIYDPNQVARTTVKETTLQEAVRNNMAPQRPAQAVVYDPNQVARTTVKETTLQEAVRNNMAPQRPAQAVVYDPNQVARTTIKETTVDNNHIGNVDGLTPKVTVRDPTNLVMRPTQKEQFSDIPNYGGIEKQNKGTGYLTAKYKAPITHRETTLSSYEGNLEGNKRGGYVVKNKNIQMSVPTKQILSNVAYTGDAYGATEVRPQSYTSTDNMIVRSNREVVDQGRVPSTEGPKKGPSAADVNATTHRQGDVDNTLLEERGFTGPDRVITDGPTTMPCAETTDKNTLPNLPLQERLDPRMLDAFRQNPYTQSLESFFFN